MASDNAGVGKAVATSQQMALSLFEDMFDLGKPISEADREIGYQRNNFFCDVSNVSMGTRRFLDAAHFIVAQESAILDRYDVELNYFKWLMRYDSRNVKHFRSIANEAQEAKVRITDTPADRDPTEDDIWIQVQMVGLVAFGKGRIRFEVQRDLAKHIRDPRKSHWLSLRISTAFTRSLARAIYDHVQQYVSAGRTEWIPLDVVRGWPGKIGANAAIFKYFKRDWLEPAVREISDVSDIELSYETRTESSSSKKIDRIRFQLKRKETADAFLANLEGAKELYTTLKEEFNLSTAQFAEISENRATWTDERITQAVEYTRWNIRRGQVKKSPAGYLMKAFREQWKMSEAERTMVSVQSQLQEKQGVDDAAKASAHAAVMQNKAQEDQQQQITIDETVRIGREHFNEALPEERKRLVRLWATNTLGKVALRRVNLDNEPVTEELIDANRVLKWAFDQFVFGEIKAHIKAS